MFNLIPPVNVCRLNFVSNQSTVSWVSPTGRSVTG